MEQVENTEKDALTNLVDKLKQDIEQNTAPMTDEELREAEEKVLFPQLDTRVIEYIGLKVTLSPLPHGPSKVLSKMAKPVTELMMNKLDAASNEDNTNKAESFSDSIDKLADLVLDASAFLANRYNLKGKNSWTPEMLEELATFEENLAFVCAQVAVNGNNDFLLFGLRSLLLFSKKLFPQIGSQVSRFLLKARVSGGV